LARATTRCVDTGYAALTTRLPGGGWPTAALTELLLQQHGIGEIRLLGPALAKVSERRVVLLDPPHAPQALALAALGLAPEHVIWLRSSSTAEWLWAAEQVLRSGSCGALVLWQTHLRAENVRRLHLVAQHGETLCFLLRPLAAALDASAAPLRLSLRPAAGGLNVGFVKRKGPSTDETLFVPMPVLAMPRPAPQRGVPMHRLAPVAAPAAAALDLLPELIR
jgi:protein ImuA